MKAGPQSDATKLRAARREIRMLMLVIKAKDAEAAALARSHQDVERSLHATLHAYDALLKAGNGAVNYLLLLSHRGDPIPMNDRETAENWAAAWRAEVVRGPQ